MENSISGSGQIQLWQFLLELLSDSNNAGTDVYIYLFSAGVLTTFNATAEIDLFSILFTRIVNNWFALI